VRRPRRLKALLDPEALAPNVRRLVRLAREQHGELFGAALLRDRQGCRGLEAAPAPSGGGPMIAGMAALVGAVQTNCDIADARHARDVSLCTYLLGMREFYRWEHQLPYGVSPPREEVGRWIASARRAGRHRRPRFRQPAVAGREFDPFAADG
jgi:hypothetical protein